MLTPWVEDLARPTFHATWTAKIATREAAEFLVGRPLPVMMMSTPAASHQCPVLNAKQEQSLWNDSIQCHLLQDSEVGRMYSNPSSAPPMMDLLIRYLCPGSMSSVWLLADRHLKSCWTFEGHPTWLKLPYEVYIEDTNTPPTVLNGIFGSTWTHNLRLLDY